MTDHDRAMAMYVRHECGNCHKTFDALPYDLPFYCERCRNTAIRLFCVMACPTDPTRNYMEKLKGTA